MACVLAACPLPFFSGQTDCKIMIFQPSVSRLNCSRLQKWCISTVSRKKSRPIDVEDNNSTESTDEGSKKTPRTPRHSRKKVATDIADKSSMEMVTSANEEERSAVVTSPESSKKISRRGRKKASSSSSSEEVKLEKKATRRRSSKKVNKMNESMDKELVTHEDLIETKFPGSEQRELQLEDDGEDISYTYGWPPLVCCFGAARYAFIPSGRPANRLIDHKIHESMKDMFWSPNKFVRAPGGSSSSVAVALAAIGGRVAFMGKLGDDEYGQNMLYYLNVNNVQTRSVKLDGSKSTATSHMKISKRGGLRLSCTRPCAEDSFLISDINVDVLKEAKMFYFSSSSLLDQSTRTTTLQAIKISKKFGGVIFFDSNLALPLWKSSEETKTFLQEAWRYADMIEVTKQELEFLCGIEPSEKFDTNDNDRTKFIHHKPEVVKQLWHENLKVLFVTNGTSKIHYYTAEDNGWVHGMEDPPITPFTGDMSVAGDAIVAALLRMLTVQPHLVTDKGYLEHTIKYAINCGVIDQWLFARICGFPPKEGMDVPEDEDRRFKSITEREYRAVQPKK
ncbi:fructokinase-like 2, chloroplastic [Musa acuminata AAA Group]|uniref:fructokinase-like 2, chloroplastic n=1 Tax=Musa acuminata AAA Group TaxID=214697 RepID=UPI0031D3713A